MKFSLTVDDIRLINSAYAYWPFGEKENTKKKEVVSSLSRASQNLLARGFLEPKSKGKNNELIPAGDFAEFVESLKILKKVTELSVYVKSEDKFVRLTVIFEDKNGQQYGVSPNQFGLFEVESFDASDARDIINSFTMEINIDAAERNSEGEAGRIIVTIYDENGNGKTETKSIRIE